jgi:hypothetical protein
MIKSRRMKRAGHVARIGGGEACIYAICWKAIGKRTQERTRYRWVDNIKMDFSEKECGSMDCINLVLDRDQ